VVKELEEVHMMHVRWCRLTSMRWKIGREDCWSATDTGSIDIPSSKVEISLRFIPASVLVPFLIILRKLTTPDLQPASPSSFARAPQKSSKNSLGSLVSSDLLPLREMPNDDFRRMV